MNSLELLKKSKALVHPVEISTGDTLYVKALTGQGRHNYRRIVNAHEGAPVHLIAALGLCNEDGTMCLPMESEKDWVNAALELKDVDGADLQKVGLKLIEVSGLGDRSVSETEKKSEASQSA